MFLLQKKKILPKLFFCPQSLVHVFWPYFNLKLAQMSAISGTIISLMESFDLLPFNLTLLLEY